ncbi:MAG: DNA repair protein RecO C-terminal domain-containing protein, partial [Prevotella sp.]|nr:DNA repair protein RecO C-terminal domain-containing protein [Prevotella sp.]
LKRFNEEDKQLFSYIENSILWLEEAIENFSNFHIVFLLRLTRFLGFYPNTDGYKEGFWFDLREGRFTSKEPLHKDYLSQEDAKKINIILRMDFPTIGVFKLSKNERNLLLDVILEYYRLHLSLKLEIKSLEVLKSLFI